MDVELPEAGPRMEVPAAPPVDVMPLHGLLKAFESAVLSLSSPDSLPWRSLVTHVQARPDGARVVFPSPAVPRVFPLAYTPLHYAAYFGRADYAALFLARGADPDARSSTGATPVAVCASLGARSVAVARALVAAGADVEAPTFDGTRPLMTAVRSGSAGVVAVLLAHGARWEGYGTAVGPGGGDGEVNGLLWEAIYRYDKKVVVALASGGVEVAGKDGQGGSAVRDMARDRGLRSYSCWSTAMKCEKARLRLAA